MKIVSLLTCYNRREKTVKSLMSLIDAFNTYNGKSELKNRVSMEIYLVDDGCTDGTAEAAYKVVGGTVPFHVLKGNGSLYWAGGMRFCWKEALKRHSEWDYYLLINDDTEMMDNMFDELFEAEKYAMDNFGKEGIVSGITCSMDNPNKTTYGGDVIINRILFTKKRLDPNGKPQMCDQTNANILLIPKSVVDKVGIFYEGYSHGIADVDYARMVRRVGLPVLLTSHYCGRCDRDHFSQEEEADLIMSMSLKERKAYYNHPLHSSHDYLISIRRNAPIRFPAVWMGRKMNIYCPKLYFWMSKMRN